jgi:tripartite-type tricarboxylate transporter receptor subunit TctC
VKGYESSTWYGLLAPRGTPRPIVKRLHAEVVALLQQPAVKDRLLADGAEPVGNTPEEFRAFIEAEIAKWGKIIKAAGLTAS